MGGLSLPHLLILALVVLVLFGRGRISEMMGDFGKGIKSFKHGMNEEIDRPVNAPPRLEQQPPAAAVPPQQHGFAPAQGLAQGQGQAMSYDPVSTPPTTDPNPPHPAHTAPPAAPAAAKTMPFDPVYAPPGTDEDGRKA